MGWRKMAICGAMLGCHRTAPTPTTSPPEKAPAPVLDAGPAPTPLHLSDESTFALQGTRMLVAAGKIRDPDAPALESALRDTYARMRSDEDDPASTLRPSRVMGAPSSPDVILYDVPVQAERSVVIFLHGYGGRFALPCWQVATAAAASAFATACPALGTEGDWWTPAGEARLRETVELLRNAGFRSFVLAGLSNGAVGASRLAPRTPGTFAGLVLVSGVDPAARPPGIPTLVLQGRTDAMAGAPAARAYATRVHATYTELDAGHFALVVRYRESDQALRSFFAQLR
ncbi:MAG: alpha/beta hydrolase [Polyangiaceae bacterium]|nr:alpha/beta hydrolase [Polyangiaceae bacterium]